MRVLCLHGYRRNGWIMNRQLRPLVGGLDAEFVASDGPALESGENGWWNGDVPDGQPYRGWDRTREWLVSTFQERGPFDGVLGFSQGAALTGLLPGLASEDARICARFVVLMSGFRSEATEHKALFAHRDAYAMPSLHVIGDADTAVPPADSLALAAMFESPVVVRHSGGHVVPATVEVRTALAEFLAAAGG